VRDFASSDVALFWERTTVGYTYRKAAQSSSKEKIL